MKYEFRAGDYVSIGGQSGYVASYRRDFDNHSFIFLLDDGSKTAWSGRISDLPIDITQIGACRFLHPHEKHISKIERDPWVRIGRAVLDKLDELVDAVNELRSAKDG